MSAKTDIPWMCNVIFFKNKILMYCDYFTGCVCIYVDTYMTASSFGGCKEIWASGTLSRVLPGLGYRGMVVPTAEGNKRVQTAALQSLVYGK